MRSSETCSTPSLMIVDRQLHIGVADQDPAAERLEQAHDLRADMAIADDADRHFATILRR